VLIGPISILGDRVSVRERDVNQAIIIDDERYIHYATNIEPEQGDVGHRDIWVVEINRWDQRAYGPTHERQASEARFTEEITA
jgi:hypothetical protein